MQRIEHLSRHMLKSERKQEMVKDGHSEFTSISERRVRKKKGVSRLTSSTLAQELLAHTRPTVTDLTATISAFNCEDINNAKFAIMTKINTCMKILGYNQNGLC